MARVAAVAAMVTHDTEGTRRAGSPWSRMPATRSIRPFRPALARSGVRSTRLLGHDLILVALGCPTGFWTTTGRAHASLIGASGSWRQQGRQGGA